MGSHSLEDKIFSTYGNSYGSRLRVVMVTKDYQAKSKKEIKKVTKTVHNMFMRQKMNPLSDILGKDEMKIFDENCYAFLRKMTCEYLDAVKQQIRDAQELAESVLPDDEVSTAQLVNLPRRRAMTTTRV